MALSPPPWRVLVFPADTPDGRELHQALSPCKEVTLFGGVRTIDCSTRFSFQNWHSFPALEKETCLPALRSFIAQNAIDALFPTDETAALVLAQHAQDLPATLLLPPLGICRRCLVPEEIAETFKEFYAPFDPALSVFSIDCFSQNGNLLFAKATAHEKTRSFFAPDIPAQDWAKKILTCLPLEGAWSAHLQKNADGHLSLFKITPFCSASMTLARVTGPNFPLLSLYAALRQKVSVLSFDAPVSLTHCPAPKFLYEEPFDALYIDLDETLLLRDKVNVKLVALIYQCRNKGIPVYLLTKHREDLQKTLHHHRLETLFDGIDHLPPEPDLSKASFIRAENAVLIEDSFHERAMVLRDKPDIRCFDVAAALCLLDERE